jgi:hypothetical protein
VKRHGSRTEVLRYSPWKEKAVSPVSVVSVASGRKLLEQLDPRVGARALLANHAREQ